MNSFCTLFDSHYLTRGLAMYRSLEATTSNFHLYVYVFDDLSREILLQMALPHMTVVGLSQFENEALLAVKPTRSRGEYCWTCTPYIIGDVIDRFYLEEVTYLDADLYFLSDPSQLLDEFHASGGSVLLTEHRYTPCYLHYSQTSGVYCVQFILFKKDSNGTLALKWWQERCLEWCYDRIEDGKFGDQKYLDDWLDRFQGVHVLEHLGGGVAPWNVQQYRLEEKQGRLLVNGVPLVFYHFHNYRWFQDGSYWLGEYQLGKAVVDLLYRPYTRALEHAKREAQKVIPGFDLGASRRGKRGLRSLFWAIIKTLKGTRNVYGKL